MQRWLLFATLLALLFLPLSHPAYLHAQQEAVSTRRVVNRVIPQYPVLARSMRLAGTVKVLVVVAPNGRPTSTKVMGGHPLLVSAAEDAVKKWKFEPASQEDSGVVEFTFRPEN